MDHITKMIAKHLYFNMSGMFDHFFHIHLIVTKSCFRLALCCLKCLIQFIFSTHDADSLAATAGRCLDHNRISQLSCHLVRLLSVSNNTIASRNNRYAGTDHHFSCIGFIAQCINNRWCRTYKLNITFFAHCRKCTVL